MRKMVSITNIGKKTDPKTVGTYELRRWEDKARPKNLCAHWYENTDKIDVYLKNQKYSKVTQNKIDSPNSAINIEVIYSYFKIAVIFKV